MLYTTLNSLKAAFTRMTESRGMKIIEAEQEAFIDVIRKNEWSTVESKSFRLKVHKFELAGDTFYTAEMEKKS
jgi:hypothetical protein